MATNMVLFVMALIYSGKNLLPFGCFGHCFTCYVSSIILSFTYFYPRNEVVFLSEQLPGTETLKKAESEWGRMNWVKVINMAAGLACSFLAWDKPLQVQINYLNYRKESA